MRKTAALFGLQQIRPKLGYFENFLLLWKLGVDLSGALVSDYTESVCLTVSVSWYVGSRVFFAAFVFRFVCLCLSGSR